VINFYGRIDLLEGTLACLAQQSLSRDRFEVILVEDRGGTKQGKDVGRRVAETLNARYIALSDNFGRMGYSRNVGLAATAGQYVLFLDDDTIILQPDFLSNLIREFEVSGADAVLPRGEASFCLWRNRYGFHAPYFPTNRCTAYRRVVLEGLGGFVSSIIGQEDVEFAIRFLAAGRRFHRSGLLGYLHPPLIVDHYRKPAAVGFSFAGLQSRYPFVVWILLLLNGCRYLPLAIWPMNLKWRMQSLFSWGFLIGLIHFATKRTPEYR
jgi:glycosyltransferase involved in cell wall biosynthesis